MAFFAPHAALVLIVVLAGRAGWAGWWWIPLLLGIALVMPHWCRWQGRTWPAGRALVLGPGMLAGAVAVQVLRGGFGGDVLGWIWTFALLFVVVWYVLYAVMVFDNRAPLKRR